MRNTSVSKERLSSDKIEKIFTQLSEKKIRHVKVDKIDLDDECTFQPNVQLKPATPRQKSLKSKDILQNIQIKKSLGRLKNLKKTTSTDNLILPSEKLKENKYERTPSPWK